MIELLNQNSYGYLFSMITRKSIWQDKLLRTDIYFLEDEEVLLRLFVACKKIVFHLIYCTTIFNVKVL